MNHGFYPKYMNLSKLKDKIEFSIKFITNSKYANIFKFSDQ